MAGLVDFILAQQGRKDAEKDRQRAEQTIMGALGRAPGTEAFAPGQGGMGLLADPTNKTRQAEFAGRLATVAPQQGSALMSGIFSNAQSGENQMTSETGATARQRLSNEQSDINSQRAAETSLSLGSMQAQVSRLNSMDSLDAALARMQPSQSGIEFGAVPSGMARVMGPNGFPMDVGIPGSQQDRDGRGILNNQSSAIENLDLFLELMDDVGTETFGADSQTLKSLNSRIGASLGELDRLGTLQPGDLVRIKEELLDPTSLWTAATTRNSTIRAGYQTLLDTFQRSHDRSLKQYEFWPGLQDFKPAPLPPGFEPEPLQ